MSGLLLMLHYPIKYLTGDSCQYNKYKQKMIYQILKRMFVSFFVGFHIYFEDYNYTMQSCNKKIAQTLQQFAVYL